ncbi:MAG TPA: NAD(P)/FAD-dependent oxidoreductase [Bryobacteraceae bacterium]|jgi:cation diffusion facilitator CzcD-associated flavoprotein CzcO|nr:NAD(P)/FAD-dependent oxidoreductase [Bryobacteraceae bacterium]
MAREYFDVLIVGAGLSGIDAAHHLQKLCPAKSYVILEQRERIGGTWDLFRYPGIRSDSDMLTMGYSFRPWLSPQAISPGNDIREYIAATARDEGIDRHIRFGHRIVRAAWSSETATWSVEALRKAPDGREEPVTLTCNFLFSCAGYYRYSAGYTPEFPGAENFRGTVVHPQAWPENLDYAGKRVVIIGSGATAVTLVPAMAKTAAKVTMLQRSPTYIVSAPAQDKIANWLRARLPAMWAYRLSRWKNVAFMTYVYQLAQRYPGFVTAGIIKKVSEHLGAEYDVATHFTPRYKPWEQRLCLVPDADLFQAIKSGRAEVVTDRIAAFTECGIQLQSGRELEADIIVTATGLVLQAFGGIDLSVDGRAVDLSKTLAYKGVMVSGVPNLASVFGYINASWTLKADLICAWVCRLLNFMDRKRVRQAMPESGEECAAAPFVENFSSGYMQRALTSWPKQGSDKPWRVYQNYLRDAFTLKLDSFDDGALRFSNPSAAADRESAAKFSAAAK